MTDVTHYGETEKLPDFHAHVPSDDLLQKIPILKINTVQSGLLTELLHIKAWLHERLTKDANESAPGGPIALA